MIIVAINRKSSTNEYLVTHTQDGKLLPARTNYVEDLSEAVYNAIAEVDRYQEQGTDAKLSDAQYTQKAITKIRPDWAPKDVTPGWKQRLQFQLGHRSAANITCTQEEFEQPVPEGITPIKSAFDESGKDVAAYPPKWGKQYAHYNPDHSITIKDTPPEREVR
jgi:hypothetical protein